jgi:hypothetical protein
MIYQVTIEGLEEHGRVWRRFRQRVGEVWNTSPVRPLVESDGL